MTPLSATDLRVGNWVYDEDDRKNRQVTPSDIVSIDFMPSECGMSPIVLTPEILIKAGFWKWSNKFFGVETEKQTYVNNHLAVRFKKDNAIEIVLHNGKPVLGVSFTGIEYLHQLQNLYHSTTGHELNIQLA